MADEVSIFSKNRKPKGYFQFTDRITGRKDEYYSAMCVHCGMHWQVIPGSGIERGWCMKCMGILCGQLECMQECVPLEVRLDREAKELNSRDEAVKAIQYVLENQPTKLEQTNFNGWVVKNGQLTKER